MNRSSWVRLVTDERITHAMVVPTMLTRIVDALVAGGERVPSLRHLSYGGGRMPVQTIEAALRLLPHVDFVNAYGLTETSSTICRARASRSPQVRGQRRPDGAPHGSARRGARCPASQIEIRGPDGRAAVPPGMSGEVFVRGEQVAGEYADGSAPGR